MKIVFISLMEGFSWGGSEELWYQVANYAIDNQQEVSVCVKQWEKRNIKIDELEKKGAKIVERNRIEKSSLFFRGVNKISSIFLGYSARSNEWSWIEKENPKHLIISLGGPNDFIHHPGLIEILNKEGLHYSVIQQFNFENIVYNDNERKCVEKFYSNADYTYFVSKRNLEVTERSICKELKNSFIVSNPANLLKLDLIPFPKNNDQIGFACVARLDCMFKAQDVLISVFSNEKWLKRNWKLNFYGEGGDYSYLTELVDYYQLNSRVTFHGHVKYIDEIWKENHILLLPSLAEGTPLSLIEAMVCGRPSIVTDVGGNSDLVEDGINGYIIPTSNVNQCDLIIEKAWQNRDKWSDQGIEARNNVLKKINFNSFKEIYNNAI